LSATGAIVRLEILNAETTHSGYDEYRYDIGSIGHNPHELMAFLTAVYGEFQYVDIESVLQGIFDAQYTLEFIPEVEIRTRTVTRTGTGTAVDSEGNEYEYSYEYEEEEEYEWHILNVVLTSVSFSSVITPLMDDDQTEHFGVLSNTMGGRQIGGSPFDLFDWTPFISSYYGYRVHPVTGEKNLHRGIDLAMPEGTPIHAGIKGTVTVAAFDSGYGNYIVIQSADGIEMKYAHCQTLYYSVGQSVEMGDVIATVGNTGTSTGAHLHMEILKNGVYLNPSYFVSTYFSN
jgi:murein DD-endopeptidase MepM/ murein hydrolase activator NlpD